MPINNLDSEVRNLREQGLTDSLIHDELLKQGYSENDISAGMSSLEDLPVPTPEGGMSMPEMDYSMPSSRPMRGSNDGNVYERIEELKENFAILHQGVLGKLSDYDSQMKDVGSELHAVSRVFKEVIPEFVENVKELKHITEKRKK